MVKTTTRILLILIPIFFWVKCDNYEFPKSPYPRAETLNVTDVSSAGVRLRGNLIQIGDEPVIDHGFVWGFQASVTQDRGNEGILRLGETASTGEFHAEVVSGLIKGTTYYVKSFVNTATYKVYGDAITFVSDGSTPPKIEGFEPLVGTWGDTVVIHGSFFGTAPRSNLVKFGSHEAKVLEASESTIVCLVPNNIELLTVAISVQVANHTAQSSTRFRLTVPVINDFSPTSGTYHDEVVITGSNFGLYPASHRVTFGGHLAQIVKVNKTSIRVKVPSEVELKTNEVRVTYNMQTAIASSSFDVLPPTITSLSKEEGFIGDEVIIAGNNFNPRPEGNTVLIGENEATILNATKQSLRVQVPKGVYPERSTSVAVTVAEQTAVSSHLFKLQDVWLKKGYTPVAPNSGGGFEINGNGYFITGNALYSYDPLSHVWSRKADFPGPARFDQQSFEAGGYGYSGLGAPGCCSGGPLVDVWRYSPSADSWSKKRDFSIDSYGVVATGVDSKGYAVDGFVTLYMYEYDPGENIWLQIGDPLDANFTGYPHFQNAAFTLDSRLFVFLAHQYNQVSNYLYEFDIGSGTWIRRAELPDGQLNGFSINGVAYLNGVSAIHRYDLTSNQLTLNVSPLADNYITVTYLFTANEKAYYLGTWENNHYEFWEFDPAYLK